MARKRKQPRTGGPQTRHVVQPYRAGKRGGLVADDALEIRSQEVAVVRAEKLFASGRYAGVDAYTVTHDPEAGEYGEH